MTEREALIEAAAKALRHSMGLTGSPDDEDLQLAEAAVRGYLAALDRPLAKRNHAPWCSFAHEGPCPAENEKLRALASRPSGRKGP